MDGNARHVPLNRLGHGNSLVLAGVGQGVVDEVVHHLPDAALIRHHGAILHRVEENLIPVLLLELVIAGQDGRDAFRQVEGRRLHLQRARLQFAEVQQLRHQRGKTVRLVNDDLHVLRGVLARNIPHDLGIAADHGQGRAQVMGDIGDQLLLQMLHLTQLVRSLDQRIVQLADLLIAVTVGGTLILAASQRTGCLIRLHNGA